MCFYEQTLYECGDFKWGLFRQQCPNEHRMGECCGMKLVFETVQVQGKCVICKKLDTKYKRKKDVQGRIDRWKREENETRKASIEVVQRDIADLNQQIAILEDKRREKQKTLN